MNLGVLKWNLHVLIRLLFLFMLHTASFWLTCRIDREAAGSFAITSRA